MTEISYPADWRDIPPERWAKMMTPEQYTQMRADRLAREALAPGIGDLAPDFSAQRLTAIGKPMDEPWTPRTRKMALAFGFFACPELNDDNAVFHRL